MNFHHALNTTTLDDAHSKVTAGAHSGAYGANDLKTPSDAQAQAGTYKMGRVTVQGLRIAIEQPQGSIRSGKSSDGKEWSSRMAAHYGYFEGTRGADGDGIDCFVGPFPESEQVFVINQRNPGGGFDEHKVMVGFASERHARGAYLDSYERGWRGLQSLVPISINQLRWWIKNGKKTVALSAESLPQEGNNPMNPKITWTEAQPDSISLDQVLYQLRRMDGTDGLLLDSVTMAEIMEDADGVIALDALVVENAQLTRMAERLRAIMDRSGGSVKAPAVQVSEPFRARGVTNIAAVFELSDGQTVSVFFHNPDTAPNKLAPGDEMISWKWLLNKKDITIVVAPEKGQDLNPRLVSQRIMRLAEKNSPAFQKANAKRAERLGNIQAIRDRITEKEGVLKGLLSDIEAAQLERDSLVAAIGILPKNWAVRMDVRSGKYVATLLGDTYSVMGEDGSFATAGEAADAARRWAAAIEAAQLEKDQRDGSFTSIKDAIEIALANTDGVVETPDSLSWALSKSSLNKMVASTNGDGAKPYQKQRILAIQHIQEIASHAQEPLVRKDDRNVPEIDAIYEYFSTFEMEGVTYKVRLLCKKFKDTAPFVDKMHSMKLDGVSADQVSPSGLLVSLEIIGDVAELGNPDLSPPPSTESQAIVPNTSLFGQVDAAYLFANATDAFKERVSGSIEKTDYSEFASAKAMDKKAKELGAEIHWGMGASLDGVAEEDDDFDPEAEFDACPVEDGDLDGDFKGHPFRGNQHKKASQHSHAAVRASMSAKHAERDGDAKGAKSAHKSAHYSHMAAAEGTTGKARKYHRKMAKFHGSRAGLALDAIEGWDGITLDDASDFGGGSIVGKIMKGGQQMGRAVIGGDGKAMVFVGESDDQRVQYWSKYSNSMQDAMWSEDDGAQMVEKLLVPDVPPVSGVDEMLGLNGYSAEQVQSLEAEGFKKSTAKKDNIGQWAKTIEVNGEKRKLEIFKMSGLFVAGIGKGRTAKARDVSKGEDLAQVLQDLRDEFGPIEKHLEMSGAKAQEAEYPPAPDGWKLEDGPSGEWVTYSKDGTRGVYHTEKSKANRGVFIIVTPDNKEHSRMFPRTGWDSSRGGYVSWEDAFQRANEVAAQFKAEAEKAGQAAADDGILIASEEADGLTHAVASKGFDEYLAQTNGDYFLAADQYFKTELKDGMKFVETAIGKVYFTGRGWKELKRGMKSDSIKASLTQYIPSILSSGKYDGRTASYKDREDGYVAFHFFEKEIELPDLIVTAGVNVGERQDGMYEYTAYGLGHSLQDAWAKRKALDSAGYEPATRAFPGVVSESLLAILGDVEQAVNLAIFKVVDKATGQRLIDLEDSPDPDPAPATADPKAEDRAFLMSVIDGTNPEILEPELADKLAQAYERHAGDAEITSLFMQAGNAYTQAMLAATEGV